MLKVKKSSEGVGLLLSGRLFLYPELNETFFFFICTPCVPSHTKRSHKMLPRLPKFTCEGDALARQSYVSPTQIHATHHRPQPFHTHSISVCACVCVAGVKTSYLMVCGQTSDGHGERSQPCNWKASERRSL